MTLEVAYKLANRSGIIALSAILKGQNHRMVYTMFMIAPVACLGQGGVKQCEKKSRRTDGDVRPTNTFLTWLSLDSHDV